MDTRFTDQAKVPGYTTQTMHQRAMDSGRPTLPTQPSLQEYLAITELNTRRASRVGAQNPVVGFGDKARHEAIQISPIIQEVVRLLRVTLPTAIQIVTTFERNLPAVMLNKAYAHQMLIDLCMNAAHAMEGCDGRLEIAVASTILDIEAARCMSDLKAGRYVTITVSDTGHGVDRETKQRIFESFFTTRKAGEGTGLGLFIVHYIVTKHSGSISFSSELGKGTTFMIYLPAVESELRCDAHANAQTSNDCRKHILVIDDDSLLVQLSTRKLQLLDYAVSGFQRPEEALQSFRANPYQFDAVIMDHYMPGIDGHELAYEMLSLRPNLPIIMISGYIRPDDAERVRQMGVRRIFTKSTALSQIDDILCSVIGPSKISQRAVSTTDVSHVT